MPSDQFIENFLPRLISIRRDFHRHPELGTQEIRTNKKIREYLDSWNIPYLYPVAQTGICAIIKGSNEGNTVALRADMDALPLLESKDRPYVSEVPGIMHACGHDAHMAIALGTAFFLKQREEELNGTVKIFFQPAEETCGGAKRMIEEGCMENPHVDFVTGLHMSPVWENGHIEIRYGKLNAASDEIHITIQGKSAHGAYPENGTDAIVIAAALIQSLQTLISRNISPLDQAVLTLGKIEGGTAGNILANQVTITGTLRTTGQTSREFLKKAIKRQVSSICHAFGGRGEVTIIPGYDALINTDYVNDLLVETAASVIGKKNIHYNEFPSMGVEDFSFFLNHAPGVFYHLGCANKSLGITAPLHTEEFDIDESCLATGVKMQLALTHALLNAPLPE